MTQGVPGTLYLRFFARYQICPHVIYTYAKTDQENMLGLTLQTLFIVFPVLFCCFVGCAISLCTLQGKNVVCKNLLKYLARTGPT